jgi:hypothetical protein
MLTVIYAAYAIGVVGALALAGHLSDWYARKRLLIPAAAFTVASAVVFLTWTSVPGLLVARVLSGVSIGLTQSTATAYLAELHARHRPGGIRQPGAGHGDDREHGWARRGGHSLPGCSRSGSVTRSGCPTWSSSSRRPRLWSPWRSRPRPARPSCPGPAIARNAYRCRRRPAASSTLRRSARSSSSRRWGCSPGWPACFSSSRLTIPRTRSPERRCSPSSAPPSSPSSRP